MEAQKMASIRNLFSGVNWLVDPHNPADLEKKHTPVIKAPSAVKLGECFCVSVEVGQMMPHPNERAHFIEFVDIYADDLFLARLDLTAVNTCPQATLYLSLSEPAKELRSYARCNIHGVWGGVAPITIME